LRDLAPALLEKAEETLAEATVLLDAGHPPGAADRCYYTMFYAASALLAQKGVQVSSHRALLAAFGRELAKTGELDVKHHRALLNAFDLRQTADYDVGARVDAETVRGIYASARDFVRMARARVLG
jgi:uncharacterized protein (UPF0332 family)